MCLGFFLNCPRLDGSRDRHRPPQCTPNLTRLPFAAHVPWCRQSVQKIGDQIATGGFGSVHLASDVGNKNQTKDPEYVLKLEDYCSGGLYAEQKCMQNCGLVAWKSVVNFTMYF